jgi:integrase
MKGSLRQRSAGSWELRVYVGTDPETGRRVDRSVTVRGSRAYAERELAEMVAAVRAVRAVGLRSSVSELLERWFAISATGWAPTTIRQTRSVLDRYLHPQLGDVAVGDVTPAMIDAAYADLRRCGGIGGRPLAPGTLARIHVVLRAAFAQAMRWGWVWDNPAERAHRIVATAGELHPPTPDELRTLLDHVATRDPQLHGFLVVAACTGARRAQLLGLRWHNVHFDTGRVSFCGGWVEGPDGPMLGATKTKRHHVVDLDPASFAVLATHAEHVGAPLDGFVFSDDGGLTAWKPNRVTKAFIRHRRAAGLRPFRLHDLRHFKATQMLHAGVPIVVVSRRLDHRRVSTTLDKYVHAVPGGDAHASATLWQILQGARPSRRTSRCAVRRAVPLLENRKFL